MSACLARFDCMVFPANFKQTYNITDFPSINENPSIIRTFVLQIKNMNLKEIVAVSGLGGLFKIQANRSDGLIVQGFDEDKSKFLSSRKHVFTPLEGITVYTQTDNEELADIFLKMKELKESNPIPDAKKSKPEELKSYFRSIVPDYDEDRVYVSDIKKLVKWFEILDKEGLVVKTDTPKEEKEAPKKEAKKTPPKKAGSKKETAKPKSTAAKKPATKSKVKK
ncbi:MAG: DUF5606 domain-containing protein [Chitinophagales bacterium]